MGNATYSSSGHIDGTLLPEDDNDVNWRKRDGVVKNWIYATLSDDIRRRTFKSGGTSRELWLRIENQFRSNKEARAIQLDIDLRSTEIGDMPVQTYCQKLRSIADLLANVDAPITERKLVQYILAGLNERFDNIINVIKLREPFPSYDDTRMMLENEETRLKRQHRSSGTHADHSSSSSALSVTPPQPDQNNNNNQRNYNNNNNRGGKRNYNNKSKNKNNNWQRNNNGQYQSFWQGQMQQWPFQYAPWGPYPAMYNNAGPGIYRAPNQPSPQANLVDNSASVPTTDMAQAFNTMTLTDPTQAPWFMDTGATSHLCSSSGSSHSGNNSPL